MMKRLFKGGTVVSGEGLKKDRSFGKRGKDSCGREKS